MRGTFVVVGINQEGPPWHDVQAYGTFNDDRAAMFWMDDQAERSPKRTWSLLEVRPLKTDAGSDNE